MEGFRAAQRHPARAMNGTCSRGWRCRESEICGLPRRRCRSSPKGRRRCQRAALPVPETLDAGIQPVMSTQMGFGKVLDELASAAAPLADRIVTTAPDVTVSTNLGPWVNRRGLFARAAMADTFKERAHPLDLQNWEFSPKGQHIELGIAEMNLFIMLSALGLSHAIFGERLIPIGTLYDPFISRGLDALNYACYQDARFMVVATPSGVTLAPEGGAHQSIATPLIGMSAGRAVRLRAGLRRRTRRDHALVLRLLQRDGEGDPDERTWLRDETGGSVYLRLSTRQLEQPQRAMTPELEQRDHRRRLLAAQARPERRGRRSPIPARSRRRRSRPSGCSARTGAMSACWPITSADRLNAGWQAAERARQRGNHRRDEPCRAAARRAARAIAASSRCCDGHPGDAGLARQRAWPPAEGARRRAFRPDRHGGRPLPAFRHRRERDRACRAGGGARTPGAPSQGPALSAYGSLSNRTVIPDSRVRSAIGPRMNSAEIRDPSQGTIALDDGSRGKPGMKVVSVRRGRALGPT